MTLHAIGNAHIDPVWLWRWTEGLETIRSTFASVLERMREFPEFHFTGSSAAFYWLLEQTEPDMLAQIRERVREGRWEIVGGWWIQPDCNIPCGESFVRQALYAQRYFRKTFGVTAKVGYNPDSFGHAGTLPQILRKAGLTRYIFMRPGPHEKTLPANVFWWQSPDGSRVLTARITRSYATWGKDLAEHVRASAGGAPDFLRDYIVFYGVGNHGGGPTIQNVRSLLEMSRNPDMPAVRLSTLKAFFEAVEAQAEAGASIPTVPEELQHHARGCYTAHSEVKRQNRRTEHLLMTAERVASMAWALLGREYPQQALTEAWQSALFNQFHDILAGTSLPEGYQDARDLYGHAATLGGYALHTSLQALTAHMDTRGEGNPLVVFNPLPWAIRVPVEVERGSAQLKDEAGNPVPAQNIQPTTASGQRRSVLVLDLPPMGYRVLRSDVQVASVQPQRTLRAELKAEGAVLENDFWRLEVNPAGHLSRLYDKRHRVEVLSAPANVGIVIDDPSDTWSHDVSSFRNELGRFDGAQLALEELGDVRACLRIETRWGHSQMTQRLYLYRDLDLIECRATINWQEQYKMLKISFPLCLQEALVTAEAPYGFTVREPNGEEEPCQQWIDLSGWAVNDDGERIPYGFALLNDSKHGYDTLGSELRLSILRSPAYAHHAPNTLDTEKRYEYIDQGIQTVTYRLMPHAGSWQQAHIPRRAWELNVPPITVNEYVHEGDLPPTASLLSVEPENVLVTVCKKAEDADALIVRAYESTGTACTVRIEMPLTGIRWEAPIGACEIKTWRIVPSELPEIAEVNLLEGAVGT
ncbi:MAG: alpha-mannosidase [Armatimonadota bacterium]|nr:MAG: alpha-mannosidase [Armatimonadota bacterium]